MPSPPRKLTLLGINVDVLAIIISYLSPADAIAFSHTCQAARAIPLDPALHTVVLNRTTEQIEKFRDHLHAVPSRQNMLKCLTLTKAVTWEIDIHASDPANMITDIVEGAKNLQLFSCGAMEDMIRASDGRMASALTSRTNLRVLELRDGGAKVVEVLSELQSPHLRELALDVTFIHKLPWNELFEPLTRYHHLETLSISKGVGRILFPFTFLPPDFLAGLPPLPAGIAPDGVAPFSPQTAPVLPSVRTLSFHNTFIPMPFAATLFPAVTRLTFRTDRTLSFSVPAGGLQHEFGTPLPCWPHALAEAHLDVVDGALWPLTCRVRWLDFDFLPAGCAQEALDAVAQTAPEVLSVAYRIDADNVFWVRLPVIAGNLRFLDIRILELSGKRRRYVLLHLSSFPALKALFLCMRAFYQPDDHDAEVAAMALELAQANRTLRVVGIALTDGRSMRDDEPVWREELLGSCWWKVERDEEWLHEVKSMEAIPTQAGLKVRDYMYAADFESPDWEERMETLV
ncbi:hypothetical protein GSI_14163 [Ganoderma sinense ZZ0214-1]|uniref:F-box domain-containing protein n=1 Tax=Ganoderma sinense ZZ0214-1 TaxID=1077348 RepID=A0A2G8RSB7_9APHY|nr:hypothetical protein GSI_14163 [Ganoderma sinense ZZ0214-1]